MQINGGMGRVAKPIRHLMLLCTSAENPLRIRAIRELIVSMGTRSWPGAVDYPMSSGRDWSIPVNDWWREAEVRCPDLAWKDAVALLPWLSSEVSPFH
jgi:hypothetical protein